MFRGSAGINFFFLLLLRHRGKHLAVLAIGTLLVALVAAVMFLTGAVQRDLMTTLDGQADLVVQRMKAGKVVDLPVSWADDFRDIPGVTAVLPRVHGRYFHEQGGVYFTVVGVDLFDQQASRDLGRLVEGMDLRRFMAADQMVAGPAVQRFLRDNHYEDQYVFKTPSAASVAVQLYQAIPAEADLLGSNMVLMEVDLARRVLGLAGNEATDLALLVPNELEGDAVMGKIIERHYDLRVIQKKELAKAYTNLFNFRGGLFLLGTLLALATFALLLYQRYGLITGQERREIGILRTVGWSIRQVITLKMTESLMVALVAFGLGTVLAYVFVFLLDAPLLAGVFFGQGNLDPAVSLGHTLDPGLLVLLFLLFVVPFMGAVLVPVWRLAVTDPAEVLR